MIRQVTNVPMYSDDQLRAACAKATADERERCARLAAECPAWYGAQWLADLIRQQP
jgi:hypothetical protein